MKKSDLARFDLIANLTAHVATNPTSATFETITGEQHEEAITKAINEYYGPIEWVETDDSHAVERQAIQMLTSLAVWAAANRQSFDFAFVAAEAARHAAAVEYAY